MLTDSALPPVAVRLYAIVSTIGGPAGLTAYELAAHANLSVGRIKAMMSALVDGGYMQRVVGRGQARTRYVLPDPSRDTAP